MLDMENIKNNLSAVLHKPLDIRLENRPVRNPAKGEVLLSMRSVGICGTDIEVWHSGNAGGFGILPTVMGHEGSGVICAIGEGVTNVKVGDRVALMGGDSCEKCDLCKDGKFNLCSEWGSNFPWDFLARYAIHTRAEQCFKLADHVSFDEGALAEPLAVATRTCTRAGITVGDNVLVCGAGSVGLLCMMVSKAMGAATVCVTDINQSKLDLAKKLGANFTVLATGSSSDVKNKVTDAIGCMPDRSVECSAAEASVRAAILSTKSGGTVTLVGLSNNEMTLPIVNAATREVDILGVLAYTRKDYASAVSLMATGRVNVKPLITHTFKLEDTLKAYELVKNQEDGVVKTIIRCNDFE
ncbi:unnamed protein product [Owenia fusiformis]|uniref:Sorbitol dehydrogenase n=1 Tax=Owenia fusiformis TaxID=6347 RepID=A0A8J1TY09_OWEFU|nr:unnamed protein product [Owenia fusiformis]